MTNKLCCFLVALSFVFASAKNRNVPHGHTGKLTPYRPGPFDIRLSKADEQKLDAGGAVMKQNMDGKEAGGAICVQDVDAPVGAVWYQILDLNNYKAKVSKVNECKNYLQRKQGDGSTRIKTKQVLGVLPGYAVCTCFCFLAVFAHLLLPALLDDSTNPTMITSFTPAKVPSRGASTTKRHRTLTTSLDIGT